MIGNYVVLLQAQKQIAINEFYSHHDLSHSNNLEFPTTAYGWFSTTLAKICISRVV